MTHSIPIDERRTTPCIKGHDRSDARVAIDQNGKPQLHCRECQRDASRAYRQRHAISVADMLTLREIERTAHEVVRMMGWAPSEQCERHFLGTPHAGNRLADLLADTGDTAP